MDEGKVTNKFDLDTVAKSNEFITGKYKVTLLEQQILAIGLSRIEVNAKDKDAPLEARLYPGELKHLIGSSTHIYRELKKVSKTMPGHTMFIEDGKGNFTSFAIITDCDYNDGVFVMRLNQKMRPLILNLVPGNFTTFELSILTSFVRTSSTRIYEIIKKEAYKLKTSECVIVTYNLSEFKFMIGLANPESQIVKNEMSRMGNDIDWDRLYEVSPDSEKSYENWTDLRKRVLDPAKKEMKEKANIRFEYEGIRKGHKIGALKLFIYKNELNEATSKKLNKKKEILDKNATSYEQLEMPKDINTDIQELYEKYVGHNELTKEDMDLLIKKADYDVEFVEKAIQAADAAPYVKSYMGWMIRYIERGGYDETSVVEGSSERAEMLEQVNENAHSDETAARVWSAIKKKEEYTNFLTAIQNEGLQEPILETIFNNNQKATMFYNWKVGRALFAGIES